MSNDNIIDLNERLQRNTVKLEIAAIEDAIDREARIKAAAKEWDCRIKDLREEIDKVQKAQAGEQFAGTDGSEVVLTPAQAMDRFNEKYAVVGVGRDVCVLCEEADAKGKPVFYLRTEKAFLLGAMNKGLVEIPKGKGTALIPAAKFWLSQPGRREYEQIVFSPGETLSPEAGKQWPRFYNIWKCWGVEPASRAHARNSNSIYTTMCVAAIQLNMNICGNITRICFSNRWRSRESL